MIRIVQFIAGLLLLIALEVMQVYFIMPFPGSQRAETVDIAYFIHENIFYFRAIGWLIIIFPVLQFFSLGSRRSKILVSAGLILYIVVFYLFNFRFLAEKIFYQPEHIVFASGDANTVPLNDLVIGIANDHEAKAYPVEIIGYHHQVRDVLGAAPVMITYCTVCRTGRVYSPLVDGQNEQFRLVGMDHFNAMFEDASTRSWWRQVSGEAITGPSKGKKLKEIPSEQMTLRAWLALHPASKVLQPDSVYKTAYEHLKKYDEGKMEGELTGRDSLSWKDKSWVVGVQVGLNARAYDWNDLLNKKVINDTLGETPLMVVIEPDSASFHVWRRDSLTFQRTAGVPLLKDKETGSTWNWQGRATEGILKDRQLPVVQSYQEFWHSWKTFHPQTTQYHPPE